MSDVKPAAKTEVYFSQLQFIGALAVIIASIAAYPLWQAIQTNGYLFYTNGVDESSYLSYPFALDQAHKRLLRPSSRLIVGLHHLGLSGGYINLLLDLTITPLTIFGFYLLFMRLSFNKSDARRAAILAFSLPLLLTPINPLLEQLQTLVAETSAHPTWLLVAPRPELILFRSPEPQLSMAVIVLLVASLPTNRWAIPVLLALSPTLYSFIRTPYLLACIACIGAMTVPLVVRVVVSLLFTSAAVTAFWWYTDTAALERFTVTSRTPLVPLSGVLCFILYLAQRSRLTRHHKIVWSALIASTILAPNLHLVTGWFIGPLKYEEYWGVVIFGLVASNAIILLARRKNLYVLCGLALLCLQSYQNFEFNRTIFHRLSEPTKIIAQLDTSPASVAVNDVYLASHLDLVHPKQSATLLSFNKTFDQHSNKDFDTYICGKRAINTSFPPEVSGVFQDIFEVLDWGYEVRGLDRSFTLGYRTNKPWKPEAGQLLPSPHCDEAQRPILFFAR